MSELKVDPQAPVQASRGRQASQTHGSSHMGEAGVTPPSHPSPGFLDLINYELIQAYCYKPLDWEVWMC